jgi:hypothetical protein
MLETSSGMPIYRQTILLSVEDGAWIEFEKDSRRISPMKTCRMIYIRPC